MIFLTKISDGLKMSIQNLPEELKYNILTYSEEPSEVIPVVNADLRYILQEIINREPEFELGNILLFLDKRDSMRKKALSLPEYPLWKALGEHNPSSGWEILKRNHQDRTLIEVCSSHSNIFKEYGYSVETANNVNYGRRDVVKLPMGTIAIFNWLNKIFTPFPIGRICDVPIIKESAFGVFIIDDDHWKQSEYKIIDSKWWADFE